MAAHVAQTVDPAQPSLSLVQDPVPGPSSSYVVQQSRAATVTEEGEEAAAEAGRVIDGANGSSSEDRGAAGGGGGGGEEKSEVENGEQEGEEQGERIPPCETLYIHNLNEKVQIPGVDFKLTAVMTQTLASLFKPYRPLLPITAHRNVRMRGQAFVSFADIESATRAKKDVDEFPLYGKSMRADVAVKKFQGDQALEQHKKERLDEKPKKRRDNILRRKAAEKLKAESSGAPVAKKQRLAMPDEYLPPNNILFVQNLPEGTTADDLREVFELHSGLVEIRTIPAKKDIAFVEFSDETTATVAKDALHNFKIDGETKMKVTYAKK